LGARVCKNQTLLIEAGADINKADDDGVTPLYIAAELGQEAIVRALIEAGADVNKATDNGWTPLSIAAQEGHTAIVQILNDAVLVQM
jgi:ankyrin repeat protein